MKIILLCSLLCVISSSKITAFNSLTKVESYAKAFPEKVKSDNNDWVDPEFGTFLKQVFKLSWFQKLLAKIGIIRKRPWDPYAFKKLIKKVRKYRKDSKYKSPFNKVIELKKGDKLIVFGDLQGAFHSMSRNLQELKNNLGLINEDLTLKSKNIYMVFIGDAISRNPYSLETLTLILSLMNKNPEHVIYLQGNHEKNKFWENFNMERELKIKAASLAKDLTKEIPLAKEINEFFNTLPKYLIIKNKKKEKFICTHSKVTHKMALDPKLQFIIVGEKRKEVIKETMGVEFLGYQNGISKWSVLSAQTPIYQKFFAFHNDAFLEVLVGDSIDKSILIAYHRHHKVKSNKKYNRTYFDPIFGLELLEKKPITDQRNVIKVGSSMYLTGINWDLGEEIKIGLEVALYHFNKQKGKNLIRPYIFDDSYSPRKALANVKRLYEVYKINKLLLPTGTSTLEAYQPLLQEDKMTVFFPLSGSKRFRKEDTKNIIHFRPEYIEEAKKLIRFLIKEYGVKRFAFFYQIYGKSIVNALHEELKAHGITQWLDLPHITTQEDFKDLADKIKRFAPDALGCFSSQAPTQKFIESIGAGFFLHHLLFTPPSLYTKNFRKFLDDKGIRCVISSIVPDPTKSKLEIAKEHTKAMQDRGLRPTIHSFAAYLATALFTDAVTKVKPPITNEKLVKYLEGLENYNFKGINISFNKETKNLIHDVWIKKLDNTWVIYKNGEVVVESEVKKEPEGTLRQGPLEKLGTQQDDRGQLEKEAQKKKEEKKSKSAAI